MINQFMIIIHIHIHVHVNNLLISRINACFLPCFIHIKIFYFVERIKELEGMRNTYAVENQYNSFDRAKNLEIHSMSFYFFSF